MKIIPPLTRMAKIKSGFSHLLRPLLVISGLAVVFIIPAITAAAAPQATPASPANQQQQLENQVETSTGAPVGGRNPATQTQTSLMAASSAPNKGIGQRVDRPAAKLIGTTRRVLPTEVLPNTKTTGVSVSGCLLDYGKPGEQCVPSRAANDKPVTCDFIRSMFPQGVSITGTDRLKLGGNGKVACGA